jgi:hypothetical protein
MAHRLAARSLLPLSILFLKLKIKAKSRIVDFFSFYRKKTSNHSSALPWLGSRVANS